MKSAFYLAGVMAAAFATVAATPAAQSAPFSEYKSVNCGGQSTCSINFSVVASKARLEIHHVSCVDAMTTGTPDVVFLGLYVLQGGNTKALYSLNSEWQGSNGTTQWWVADAPTLAHVKAGQRPSITITLDAVPAAQQLSCTISGFKL